MVKSFKVKFKTTRFPVHFQIDEEMSGQHIKMIQMSTTINLTKRREKFAQMIKNDDMGLILNFEQLKQVVNEIEKRLVLEKLEKS